MTMPEDYSDPRVKPNKSHVSKVISRCSSIDSQPTQPRSPFQSNPLLTAHDYAKSPLMEGLEEESNYDSLERGSNDSNDGSNIDSENIDSIDSLGPSDSASERVDSAVGDLLVEGEDNRGDSRVEGSNEDEDEGDAIDGDSGGRQNEISETGNAAEGKMVDTIEVTHKDSLVGKLAERSSPSK